MSTALSVADRIRRDWYLLKLDALNEDLPGKHQRAVRRELRAEITTAAQEVGMRRALRDLGPVSALAAGYREAEGRRLPRWWTGVACLAVVWLGWLLVVAGYTTGLVDAAGQTTPAGATFTVSGTILGVSVETTGDVDVFTVGVNNLLIPLGVALVVMLVTARAWRALPRRHRPRDHTAEAPSPA